MKERLPNTVDEYISARPEVLRPKLEQVRAAIRRAVPEAQEVIGYGMPGYKLKGKPLLYFAGFKQHYSLFAASGTFFASLEKELRDYEQRKGTIHFPLNKPVPVQLISRIAKLRAAGISATTKERGARPTESNAQVATKKTARPASGSLDRSTHRDYTRLMAYSISPARRLATGSSGPPACFGT